MSPFGDEASQMNVLDDDGLAGGSIAGGGIGEPTPRAAKGKGRGRGKGRGGKGRGRGGKSPTLDRDYTPLDLKEDSKQSNLQVDSIDSYESSKPEEGSTLNVVV